MRRRARLVSIKLPLLFWLERYQEKAPGRSTPHDAPVTTISFSE
jgi:hypothetical protein